MICVIFAQYFDLARVLHFDHTYVSIGKFLEESKSDSIDDCVDCDVGKYVGCVGSDHVSDCNKCAPGMYGDRLAQVACKDCGIGTYMSQVCIRLHACHKIKQNNLFHPTAINSYNLMCVQKLCAGGSLELLEML